MDLFGSSNKFENIWRVYVGYAYKIVKTFLLADKECAINIQGTYDTPLFKANDIGHILDIKKIRNTICHFNENEKVALRMGSLGGIQETIFLTEEGLYRLIGMSRKPIAQIFQRWVINVIKEIRITV